MYPHREIDTDYKLMYIDIEGQIVPMSIGKCKLYKIAIEALEPVDDDTSIADVALRLDASRSTEKYRKLTPSVKLFLRSLI